MNEFHSDNIIFTSAFAQLAGGVDVIVDIARLIVLSHKCFYLRGRVQQSGCLFLSFRVDRGQQPWPIGAEPLEKFDRGAHNSPPSSLLTVLIIDGLGNCRINKSGGIGSFFAICFIKKAMPDAAH